MAAWSRLLLSGARNLLKTNGSLTKAVSKNESIRWMSGHSQLPIRSSLWQWHKTKDLLHFYFFVGAIPLGIITFCANVFVGPATLEPIPEGYTPKRWEYFRSPITRFFARYLCLSPQQEYEKYLHFVVHHYEIKKLRDLQRQVKESIRYHQDYPAFSYRKSLNAAFVKEYRKRSDEGRF